MTKLRTANLLGALAGAVVDRLQERLKRHPNQTDSAASALHLIALYEGCSNVMLAQALKLSHSATVRLVDKLEAEKLVESRPGTDRRSVALTLTAAGKERTRETLEDRCVALGELIDSLSPEQQHQLDALAETLLRALTTTPLEGAHICRLCDEAACPPAHCPVHQRAHELSST